MIDTSPPQPSPRFRRGSLAPDDRRVRALLAALGILLGCAWSALAALAEDGRATRELSVTPSPSGQFVTNAAVNGASLSLIIDTGASRVVLTFEDAKRAGLVLKAEDFTQVAETANGATHFAPIVLDRVALGPFVRRNIPALVAEQGRLKTSLLGMTFLSQLSKVGMRDGLLVLSN